MSFTPKQIEKAISGGFAILAMVGMFFAASQIEDTNNLATSTVSGSGYSSGSGASGTGSGYYNFGSGYYSGSGYATGSGSSTYTMTRSQADSYASGYSPRMTRSEADSYASEIRMGRCEEDSYGSGSSSGNGSGSGHDDDDCWEPAVSDGSPLGPIIPRTQVGPDSGIASPQMRPTRTTGIDMIREPRTIQHPEPAVSDSSPLGSPTYRPMPRTQEEGVKPEMKRSETDSYGQEIRMGREPAERLQSLQRARQIAERLREYRTSRSIRNSSGTESISTNQNVNTYQGVVRRSVSEVSLNSDSRNQMNIGDRRAFRKWAEQRIQDPDIQERIKEAVDEGEYDAFREMMEEIVEKLMNEYYSQNEDVSRNSPLRNILRGLFRRTVGRMIETTNLRSSMNNVTSSNTASKGILTTFTPTNKSEETNTSPENENNNEEPGCLFDENINQIFRRAGPRLRRLGHETCVPHTIALSMNKLQKIYQFTTNPSILNRDGSINNNYVDNMLRNIESEDVVKNGGITISEIKKLHENADIDSRFAIQCDESGFMNEYEKIKTWTESAKRKLPSQDCSMTWINQTIGHTQIIENISLSNNDDSVTLSGQSTVNPGNWGGSLKGPGGKEKGSVTLTKQGAKIEDDSWEDVPLLNYSDFEITMMCCRVVPVQTRAERRNLFNR